MRVFQEPEPDYGREALTFALGAAGGLALGLLIVRGMPTPGAGRLGSGIRDRARTVAGRLRPARLRRMGREQRELGGLEDAVLEAFFADATLSERGIDVGAISPGIVELSGAVYSEEEADRAVRIANGVGGVRTVVNRMEIEEPSRARRGGSGGEEGRTLVHESGRTGGMGTRRQGRGTDPETNDSSHQSRLDALRDADRGQWEDEGYAGRTPRAGRAPWRARYREDEVIPQDPHGKHARVTLDAPPQALNSDARVGEGMKKAERLALEQADVPLRPTTDDPGRSEGQTD